MKMKKKKDIEEDSFDLLLKISNKLLPNSLKLSLVLILVGILIYIILCIFNIIEVYN